MIRDMGLLFVIAITTLLTISTYITTIALRGHENRIEILSKRVYNLEQAINDNTK